MYQSKRDRQHTALDNRVRQLQAWKDGSHELSNKDKERNLLPKTLKAEKIRKAEEDISVLKKALGQ